MQILIVEDERLTREGIQSILEVKLPLEKHRISCAVNGAEGIEKALAIKPDIIITDIKMPEMNGLEMIRFLHRSLPSSHFIIVSCYSEFHYAQTALKFKRVHDYLLKPISWTSLVEAIRNIQAELGNADTPGISPDSIGDSVSDENKEGNAIEKAKRMIHDNYGQDINLQTVAERLYLNPSYLSTIFKNATGQGFSDYLIEVRIKQSQRLLKETELYVYTIAQMVGYKSEKHFINIFKKRVGCSPNKFRNA